MAIDRDEVTRRLKYYPPDEAKRALHESVRATVGDAGRVLADILPNGREKSLAITALEEAAFWANAAIARSAD